MRRLLLAGVAVATIGGLASMGTAQAFVITGSVNPPLALAVDDFGINPTAGYVGTPATSIHPSNAPGQTIDFVAGSTSPYSGIYAGDTNSVAKSPFAGAGAVPGGYLNYLAAEPGGGSVTITFDSPQTSFNLLWGTVDSSPTDYNKIVFNFGGGIIVTGADIASALGISGGGTVNANVSIADLASFTTVTATASSIAFEFAPAVPEPGSLALLGTGLLGLGLVGWGSKKRRAA